MLEKIIGRKHTGSVGAALSARSEVLLSRGLGVGTSHPIFVLESCQTWFGDHNGLHDFGTLLLKLYIDFTMRTVLNACGVCGMNDIKKIYSAKTKPSAE